MKRVYIVVAALLALTSVCRAQLSAKMSIIHHNIHSGGQPRAAADAIIDLLEMTPQKAIVQVNEANYAREYFDFSYGGWHNIWPSSPFEGRGNAIFVRDAAATLVASWVMTMQEPWTHNKPKDPRIYPVVRCQLVANPWVLFHCVDVHFPTDRAGNGPARQESVDRLIELSETYPDQPLIICGDFNMGEDEVRRRVAVPIGGKLYSNASVDHIIVRDSKDVGFADPVKVTRLGLLGSDHQALRYDLTFKQLDDPSGISDWSLY